MFTHKTHIKEIQRPAVKRDTHCRNTNRIYCLYWELVILKFLSIHNTTTTITRLRPKLAKQPRRFKDGGGWTSSCLYEAGGANESQVGPATLLQSCRAQSFSGLRPKQAWNYFQCQFCGLWLIGQTNPNGSLLGACFQITQVIHKPHTSDHSTYTHLAPLNSKSGLVNYLYKYNISGYLQWCICVNNSLWLDHLDDIPGHYLASSSSASISQMKWNDATHSNTEHSRLVKHQTGSNISWQQIGCLSH